MKKETLLSIIVPAFNAERTLGRCLDGILDQTYKNLEVIVIDDGSEDATGSIADRYAKQDGRVRVVHQENSGLVGSREKGIALANGDFVGFVDSDDEVTADMYERLIENAEKYEAGISQCGILAIDTDGSEEKLYGTGITRVYDRDEGLEALLCGQEMEPSLCNKIYARELLRDSCLDKTVVNNEDLLRNVVLFDRVTRSVTEDFCGYWYIKGIRSMSKDMEKSVEISRHVMKARKTIIKYVDEKSRPFAHYSYLTSVVGSFYSAMNTDTPEAKELCRECMRILRQYEDDGIILEGMPSRLKIKIKMILKAPGLFRAAQSFYTGIKRAKTRGTGSRRSG